LFRKLYRDKSKLHCVSSLARASYFSPISSLAYLHKSASNAISRSNMRSCRDPIGDLATLAATLNVESDTSLHPLTGGPFGEVNLNAPTQIQLCPWFIDWIKSKEFKTGDQVRRTKLGRGVVRLAEKNQWPFRQIGMVAAAAHAHRADRSDTDAFALLDKVLVHEMTHGRAVWNRQKILRDGHLSQLGTTDVSPAPVCFS
jgi:hypothetical protein